MVDSPYYRPPDEAQPTPPVPLDGLAFGTPPVPFDAAATFDPVAPVRPRPPVADGSPAAEPDAEDPHEEIWRVVASGPSEQRAQDISTALADAGFEGWVRPANEYGLSTGLVRTYEVLVRDVEADAAEPIVETAEAELDAADAFFAESREPTQTPGCRRSMVGGMVAVLLVMAAFVVLAGLAG